MWAIRAAGLAGLLLAASQGLCPAPAARGSSSRRLCLTPESPEAPRFSCYRRSHEKDVLCEWQPQQRPSRGTRAVLWVKKWLTAENATEQRCRYFSKAEKFTCRIAVLPRDDDAFLLVSTCVVSNGTGSGAGQDQVISANRVLKPDPPGNVRVDPVENSPQKLRVNWTYPPSWDPRFYRLHFQVRYRAEHAQSYTEIERVRETSLAIHDAWRGARHVVQVRGMEEFGHGSWSQWSPEVVGTPWTDRSGFEVETGSYSSQFPSDDGFYGDRFTFPPELYGSNDSAGAAGGGQAGSAHSTVSPYTFLVAGGSLLLGTGLLAGIMVRYKKKWRRGSLGRGKASLATQHPLVPLAPQSPTSEAPLLSPPASPGSGDVGPYDVTNLDYLLVPLQLESPPRPPRPPAAQQQAQPAPGPAVTS